MTLSHCECEWAAFSFIMKTLEKHDCSEVKDVESSYYHVGGGGGGGMKVGVNSRAGK